MAIQNAKMQAYDFLREMYEDDYFPDFLVDKVKAILVELCEEIEKKNPRNPEELFVLTHAATEKINDLQEEFEDNGSELETVARDVMGGDFEQIVTAYGFTDIDVEDVIAPRDW